MEITHQLDDVRHYRQVVSARRLRQILADQGESTARPNGFGPEDEWDVGDDDLPGE